jgi:hypothetical protein
VLTKATKTTKGAHYGREIAFLLIFPVASMASSLSLAVPQNVVAPAPRIAKENAPPSAFRQPNRGKMSRKPLPEVFGAQVQTAAVNFGDDDSSTNPLSHCSSISFTFRTSLLTFR